MNYVNALKPFLILCVLLFFSCKITGTDEPDITFLLQPIDTIIAGRSSIIQGSINIDGYMNNDSFELIISIDTARNEPYAFSLFRDIFLIYTDDGVTKDTIGTSINDSINPYILSGGTIHPFFSKSFTGAKDIDIEDEFALQIATGKEALKGEYSLSFKIYKNAVDGSIKKRSVPFFIE